MSISYLVQDFEVRSFIAMHDWRSRVSFLARPVGFYTCSCIQHFAAVTQPVLAILHNFAPFCRISCNRLLVSWHTCNQRMQAGGLTAKLELIISRKFGANWILQLRGNKQNKHNVTKWKLRLHSNKGINNLDWTSLSGGMIYLLQIFWEQYSTLRWREKNNHFVLVWLLRLIAHIFLYSFKFDLQLLFAALYFPKYTVRTMIYGDW